MADNEKEVVEGTTTPRGADWEVVTLTASAYEAAPGPDGKRTGTGGPDTSTSSDALLMSHHFVFPPSEHENLPIETSFDEIQPEDLQKESTGVESYTLSYVGVKHDAESERIQFIDEGKSLLVDDFEMYGSPHSQDDGRGSVVHDEGADATYDSDDKSGQPSRPADCKSRGTGASCKCWLKKHMVCLYNQAKETNTIWSVVVAAALVGIVILGRWHKDKLHLDHLKWRSGSAVRG